MASLGRSTYHLSVAFLCPSAEPFAPLFFAGAAKSKRPVLQRLTLDEINDRPSGEALGVAERDGVVMGTSATQARERQSKTEGMAARILIVDDHEIVREGIRTLLRRIRPEWEVCGEAKNGKEAVEAAAALTPDILILDVTMPVMSGLEAASRIARIGPRFSHSHLHHARNEKSYQRSPRHRRSGLHHQVPSLPRCFY